MNTRVEDHLPALAFCVYELQEEGEAPLAKTPCQDQVFCKCRDLQVSNQTHHHQAVGPIQD